MHKRYYQLQKIMENQRTNEIVTCVILLNGLSLLLATSSYMTDHFSWLLNKIEDFSVIFFITEITARCFVMRLRFFKSAWNVFDLLIMIISIIPATGYFTVLRTLRILRLVRIIRFFPKMHFLITSIDRAIPGMISISSLLLLFFIVFSIISFHLFKDIGAQYFGTIDNTMFTMFQIMMNDNWAGIVRPLMEKMPYSNLYFIGYTVIMKFTLLNLFFGLIINSMQAESRKESKTAVNKLIKTTEMNEKKIEATLEAKIDILTAEIQSLRTLINSNVISS